MRFRAFLAILLCKGLRWFSRVLHRGGFQRQPALTLSEDIFRCGSTASPVYCHESARETHLAGGVITRRERRVDADKRL